MEKKWLKFWLLLVSAIVLVGIALFGENLVPYDPLAIDYEHVLLAPCREHLFGTDHVGRDVFSRILAGAKPSFMWTFLLVGIVAVLGTCIGSAAGFLGGVWDAAVMRLSDILLAFPETIFAIAVVGVVGPGLSHTVMALSLIWWTKYARMARGMTSIIKTKDYIIEAKFGGVGRAGILFRYILPNLMPQVVVMAALDIGKMMLALAGLSFLGLATQPPAPEWGAMLYEGKSYLQTAPWLMIFSGLAIFVTVLVFNLLGDSLRDLMDPKEQ